MLREKGVKAAGGFVAAVTDDVVVGRKQVHCLAAEGVCRYHKSTKAAAAVLLMLVIML